MVTVHAQMRLASSLDTLTYATNIFLTLSTAISLEVKHGEIKFNDVSFAYDPNKPLLNHFNLTIKPGEKVGLIGRSGAGKSTIVNLLLRFYEAQEGSITIDGQNILDVSQESLRQSDWS